MKITRLELLHVAPNLLVRVCTDEGIVACGECSPMNNALVAAHIEHTLAPLVAGRDPFDVEALVERMFVATYKLAASTPNCRCFQEYNIEPHPLQDSLFREPVLEVRNGCLAVPEGPGLGVEINEDILPSPPPPDGLR